MTKMRFGPFQWPVNPTELRVEDGRNTREALFPSPALYEEGPLLRTISGRGCFIGPDAAAQFSSLHALLTGRADDLTLPQYGPLRAVLTELSLLRGSMQMIEYAFTFRESPEHGKSAPCAELTAAVGPGETLWHLANRFSIPIERLLACNPEIPEPWSAEAGKEVRLQ